MGWFAILEQNLSGLLWSGVSLSPQVSVTARFALAALSALIAAMCFEAQGLGRFCAAIFAFAAAMPLIWFVSLPLSESARVYLVWPVFCHLSPATLRSTVKVQMAAKLGSQKQTNYPLCSRFFCSGSQSFWRNS